MKKTLIVFGCCLLATAALAGCKPKAPAAPEGGNKQGGNGNAAVEESFSGSVNDLVKRGVPIKCTFSQEVDGVTQSGTAYVSGSNVRTESDATVDGKAIKAHMIKAGDWQYVWSDMTPGKGTKFMMTEQEMKEMQEKYGNEDTDQNIDLDTNIDMKCVSWVVDSSLFNPPANIVFTDMTEMMKGAMNQAAGMPSDACAVCDQVPASVREQCLQSCQ